ncbi:transcriptional regulator, PadR family [Amycolatopsis marina]|uniref:Transcriptional regulator, PadR family n=1 Tax=Amycolatopsis marina TaxID=490629 RepID=A0A1I1BGK8_9PSEU|nr:PadR family transcriptional regulator [Amycolatopsis marina]SFB47630.1 transcriptional regulator, PadR family [Amycolatopsis marina]
MSATRLLVLGVVQIYGQAHGYQVRQELLSWNADKWANVQPGSIYHALKKLTKEGLLELVEPTGEPGGPDRVAYRVTASGEAQFDRLLQTMLAEVRDDSGGTDLAAALSFLPALTRERAISLLTYRLTQLEGKKANLDAVLLHGSDWGQPEHVNALYRMWLSQIEAARTWTNDLIERLRAGEYAMADDTDPASYPPKSPS